MMILEKVTVITYARPIPLVCKNFKMKMLDHLLLGGEHTTKSF